MHNNYVFYSSTCGEVVDTDVQEALVGSPRPPGPSTGPEPSSSKSSSSLNQSSSSFSEILDLETIATHRWMQN